VSARPGPAAAVALAAIACAALYAWPMAWDRPQHPATESDVAGDYTWAPDEIVPSAVIEGLGRRFSGGWHSKYPPFHYVILAAAYAPWLGQAPSAARTEALIAAGRVVSVAMAVGIVILVYLCGRELYGPAPALFAALVAGLAAPLAYYAKTANVDVPYLFWFAGALLFYLRALAGKRTRDCVALAVCAAAAVATKDQAYGLFVLAPLAFVRELDRRLLAAAALAGAAYLVFTNALLNPSGFAAHVALITGAASRDFRMYERSAAGLLALAIDTGRAVVFVLGVPAAAAALLGLGLALARWRENRRLLATLAFPVGYWLAFLAVVLYLYDRFVLPIAIVLALFAGHALATLLARARARPLAIAAAAGVIAFSALRAFSMDVLMARDSRHGASAWLHANAPPPTVVAAVGPLEYLPRLEGLRWRRLGPSLDRLRQVAPEVVVVNADFSRRAIPGGSDAELYAALAAGQAGYRLARAEPRSETLPFLDLEGPRGDSPRRVHTNLDKVGPPIFIYVRERTPR
jgi:4-amino-4-deoxy-L-arabinose transferase-like glycosyltransferase